ncbi:hypothetical protein GE09DRAFT_88974 [Coniochaeta sp. 2T2.1]|nr:hypothetical protein GE09DRAFT_88974 [Coniochaeta sp. 2T2.1]
MGHGGYNGVCGIEATFNDEAQGRDVNDLTHDELGDAIAKLGPISIAEPHYIEGGENDMAMGNGGYDRDRYSTDVNFNEQGDGREVIDLTLGQVDDQIAEQPPQDELQFLTKEATVLWKARNQPPNRDEVLRRLGFDGDFQSWTHVLLSLSHNATVETDALSSDPFSSRSTWRGNPVQPLSRQMPNDWADDDPEITANWNQLLLRFKELAPDLNLSTLCKPSGTSDADVSFTLHYSTWRTKNPIFGSVNDPSNPCLREIDSKLGRTGSIAVRMQDRVVIRHDYEQRVRWEEEFPRWDELSRLMIAFNKSLNQRTKILVIAGRSNFEAPLTAYLDILDSEEVVRLNLKIDGLIYAQRPHYIVVRDKLTEGIKRAVFFVYHPMHFLMERDPTPDLLCYHDLVFNVASELAGITDFDPLYFSRKRPIEPHPLQQLSIFEETSGARMAATGIREVLRQYIANGAVMTSESDQVSHVANLLQSASNEAVSLAKAEEAARRRTAKTARAEARMAKAAETAAEKTARAEARVAKAEARMAKAAEIAAAKTARAEARIAKAAEAVAAMTARGEIRQNGVAQEARKIAKEQAAGAKAAEPDATTAANAESSTQKTDRWRGDKLVRAAKEAQLATELVAARTQPLTPLTAKAIQRRHAKLEALSRAKPVRDLIAVPQDDTLCQFSNFFDFRGRRSRGRERGRPKFENLSFWKIMIDSREGQPARPFTCIEHNFLGKRVIWWSKEMPTGLRYDGDGCEEPDTFDYSQAHTAILYPH